MSLMDCIKRIQDKLRAGLYLNESSVSQGAVLPILQALEWPVFETDVVIPEYSTEGGRVDFALCHPSKKPKVFIEVKRVGNTEGADRQLFEYAFHQGVPLAILTDGQEWNFFLPGEQGNYQERRVYKLDLLERELEESEKRLQRYLNYKKVCSNDALEAARNDYRDVSRDRIIEETLPQAWNKLLEEQDDILLELLAVKVEDICGFKPDIEKCAGFFRKFAFQVSPQPASSNKLISNEIHKNETQRFEKVHIGFSFKGSSYKERSAKDVMIHLFKLLAERDSSFLERFAARKHGTKIRYLDRNRKNLNFDRPDLVNEDSEEIVKGWWIYTKLNNNTKEKIIKMACEVASLQFGKDVIIELGN